MEVLIVLLSVMVVVALVLAALLRTARGALAQQRAAAEAATQAAAQRMAQCDAAAQATGQRAAQLEITYGPLDRLAERAQALQLQLQRLEAAHQDAVNGYQAQERELFVRRDALRHQLEAEHLATTTLLKSQERAMAGRLEDLKRAVGDLESEGELASSGFYKVRYNFGSSAEYSARLDDNRARQKELIKRQMAVLCTTAWTVDGSKKAGEKMIREYIKLMLRAFNGECDTAVLKVRYNNVDSLENRVRASFDAINKISEPNHCQITQSFLELKIAELYLVHEYQDKKQQELEEQREIREQMREEERAQRELEKAKEDAEKEQSRFEFALEKAREDVENATGKARAALEGKIGELERRLAEAQQKQRAISQAQLTTSGHVYVISNIGSFGEKVFKIGMTRRLEPMDRVVELGDASVPFAFDVHAMVYSQHAPELERRLHQRFADRRVNRINERREFFEVTLDEVEAVVREVVAATPEKHPKPVQFTRTAAAEEYRRSLALAGRTPGASAPMA